MSAILRLAAPHERRIASLRGRLQGPSATTPPWLRGLVLALFITSPAWLPFLHPDLSLPQLHDGTTHVVRAHLLQQHIASGDWYPRWSSEHYGSYGYPALNFYAPATYYLTVLLAWLLPLVGIYGGLQLVGAIAALGMLSGVYTLGWQLWRHGPAALFATAIVAYAPYPLAMNLFLRGAMPEVVGAGLLVWLLVGCTGLWLAAVERRQLTAWWLFHRCHHHSPTADPQHLVHPRGLYRPSMWIGCLWLWRPHRSAFLVLAGTALGRSSAHSLLLAPSLAGNAPRADLTGFTVRPCNYRNWFLTWPG